jgi:hypothetical protein
MPLPDIARSRLRGSWRDGRLTQPIARLAVEVVGLRFGRNRQARDGNKHDPPSPVHLAGLLFGEQTDDPELRER